MKLHEITELPLDIDKMRMLAAKLQNEYSSIARDHGLDLVRGGADIPSPKTPVVRRDMLLFGGALVPADHKGSDPSATMKDRVKGFLVDLHKSLLQLQVKGLNGDLGLNFHIYIGSSFALDGSGLLRLDNTPAQYWANHEVKWPHEERCIATWLIAR